ncbi:MAG: hypothetical protein IPO04_05565 [Cytophagaceae bacterium]|nr:hypothetical protein [Cytophagaceae bacterium]
MANIFNDDFRDFIRALNKANVEYILVGGYSVILHGYARTTGDLDVWVKPTQENYLNLESAFKLFGMPLFDLTKDKFLNTEQFDVFIFGRPPVSIEILTLVKGLDFEEAFKGSRYFEDNGLAIRTIQFHHLIEAKKAAGRSRDINDIEQLIKKNS